MPEITPRVLLFTLDPQSDGSFTLGRPALELDREEATYQWQSDTQRKERVSLSPGEKPTERTVVCRRYSPEFEEIYIPASEVK